MKKPRPKVEGSSKLSRGKQESEFRINKKHHSNEETPTKGCGLF
jgi:hypothetical protein